MSADPVQASPELLPSFGWTLVKTLAILLAICAAAVFVIRLGLGRWDPKAKSTKGLVVLDATRLGPRHAVYVVRAGSKVYLLGTAEGGGVERLDTLSPEEWASQSLGSPDFSEVVEQAKQSASSREEERGPLPNPLPEGGA
ncbi:MAG: flagellar biosynthetic protein FliO [Myxococcales bacterium]|nr:flagellar biosynthetic protein FliO [Myxococcales bacterium]